MIFSWTIFWSFIGNTFKYPSTHIHRYTLCCVIIYSIYQQKQVLCLHMFRSPLSDWLLHRHKLMLPSSLQMQPYRGRNLEEGVTDTIFWNGQSEGTEPNSGYPCLGRDKSGPLTEHDSGYFMWPRLDEPQVTIMDLYEKHQLLEAEQRLIKRATC